MSLDSERLAKAEGQSEKSEICCTEAVCVV